MIDADSLERMRATIIASLPDSCQVQSVTFTPDGAGGGSESWSDVATVACRLSPTGRSPQERMIADKLQSLTSFTVTLPALTAVSAANRLVIGGRTFRVEGVLARSDEIARRVVCTEVTDG